ncbi:DUF4349 domain-containing protein [Streptomyces griseorubiginosus]|uniref:DUF4349 domain-containing protein n=1 Tax=Streptomyces griseorubiginosus TaxID=67304 RepID=UPI002E81F133|nr:DUF4349 domain-containing protein [Streptomyces griseorubiginosus]WUB43641.1 DUF4349 domain-containing protein [Streptomyces griseorubiginosus]WUB52160.1 DUF4349 domain-containing protein [Streptomyces griseorubiginosus]
MRTPRSRRSRRSVRRGRALAGLLLAGALALTGCSGAGDNGANSASEDRDGAAQAQPESGAGAQDAASGKQASSAPKITQNHIIRTASLTVQVKDVPKALDAARTTTENAGGFVGKETTTRDEEGNEQTQVVLRVPVEKYDEVLADLEGAGKLLERTANAQDVTDQVVDVNSRIATQRASVARIRELMDKATKLSDVVTLEGELSTREADLESLLARQASLKDRTTLATITLSLSEKPVVKAEEDDDPGIADALTGGWDAFVTMLRWIVVALAAVLPFLAGLALLALLWLRLIRPRLPRRPAPTSVATALGPLPVAHPAPDPNRPQERGEED